MNKKRTAIFITSLLLFSIELAAQYPDSRTRNNRNNPANTPQRQKVPSRDTLSKKVYYFYADNAEEKFLFEDSSLINFHIYDPVRQANYEYSHLGNLGSAHRPLVYQQRFHKGFDMGFHNYDLYWIRAADIKYYELEKAYSDIYFTQGTGQDEISFKAKFSKNFADRINFGLDYQNINNEGQYINQISRTNALSFNSWYRSSNHKYRAYLSFTMNTIEQKENGGGLITDSNFTKDLIPIGRPVNTEKGESRYFQRDINFSHYYKFRRTGKDTLNPQPKPSRQYTLKHELILRRNTYKYFDDQKDRDGSYYGPFLTDSRGIRNYIETNQFENSLSIRTFRLDRNRRAKTNEADQKLVSNNTFQKDLVELGLTHTFTDIYQEPIDSTVNTVFLFGKIQFTPSEQLQLKTYAHLGVLGQTGDYYVKGDLLLGLKRIGEINLKLITQSYTPNLLSSRFYVTQRPIWNNNFKKVFETSLSASYYLPLLKLDIIGNYHLLNNFIYYDTNAFPQQASSALNMIQLILKNRLSLGKFHLQNMLYFQIADEHTKAVFRFPELYSVHRLYYTARIFKKAVDAQLGTDVRLNTPYYADNFQPVTAQFFLQNQQKVAFHPVIDVFLNFRIQQFRFFFVLENVYDYISPDISYMNYTYPRFDSQFRFGFRWLFLD